MTNFEKIKQMSIDEMARSCMNFFDCLAKNKTTFDSKGRFCKVYKAKDFKRGQRISGQNTQG